MNVMITGSSLRGCTESGIECARKLSRSTGNLIREAHRESLDTYSKVMFNEECEGSDPKGSLSLQAWQGSSSASGGGGSSSSTTNPYVVPVVTQQSTSAPGHITLEVSLTLLSAAKNVYTLYGDSTYPMVIPPAFQSPSSYKVCIQVIKYVFPDQFLLVSGVHGTMHTYTHRANRAP